MHVAKKMMEYGIGTPKNLDDLAKVVLLGVTGCNLWDMQANIKACIKDYLAQSFATAMLTSESEKESEKLQKLFDRLVSNAPKEVFKCNNK